MAAEAELQERCAELGVECNVPGDEESHACTKKRHSELKRHCTQAQARVDKARLPHEHRTHAYVGSRAEADALPGAFHDLGVYIVEALIVAPCPTLPTWCAERIVPYSEFRQGAPLST